MKNIKISLLHNGKLLIESLDGRDIAHIDEEGTLSIPSPVNLPYVVFMDIAQAVICHSTLREVLRDKAIQETF